MADVQSFGQNESKIDLDRGVIKSIHPTGVAVHMYLDAPGEYLSIHGTRMSETLAAEAGFDTEKFAKQRKFKALKAQAEAKIKAEIEAEEEMSKVVLSRGGFSIVDIGVGRFQVVGEDGVPVHKEPLSRELADKLFAGLVPDEE